jgi:hypothetical protein
VGNRTRTHGNESKPVEINMSSAMNYKPGLATWLTPSFAPDAFAGVPLLLACPH